MDPLAELPDAADFQALLAREELRRGRTREILTVACLDVDGLRRVNKHHGAAAGTELLRLCVTTLRASIRAVDEIARTGPDEFAVLMHGTDARSAATWADRFEDELQAASFELDAGPITCSIGLSDTSELSLLETAVRAHRRMEVVQTMRKLRRMRDGGAGPTGAA